MTAEGQIINHQLKKGGAMKTMQALRHPQRGQVMGIRQITAGDVASRQAPIRLVRNIRRGHLIAGMRDIARIGWKSWEESVADIQRLQERRFHNKANRIHEAVRSAHTRLGHVQKHKDSLEAILDSVRDWLKQAGKKGSGHDSVPLLSLVSPVDVSDKDAYQMESCTATCDRVIDLLFSRADKEKASIHRHAARGTPRIWMRPSQIQQVIFNLISNSLDSIKETRKKKIDVDVRRKGGFVQLAISDTGCGIPVEQRDKVFEPFYTTKPAGQGTGLGLFISRRIVEAHGGSIACESKVKKGTTIKVLLPIKKGRR